jgi:hypothetical protein
MQEFCCAPVVAPSGAGLTEVEEVQSHLILSTMAKGPLAAAEGELMC